MIKRFRKLSYEKNKKFYNKLFDQLEISYCLQHKDPYPHFAAKFAIKEAIKKALKQSISFTEIHTSHGKYNEPIAKCSYLEKKHCELSVSHEKEIAVAIAIITF